MKFNAKLLLSQWDIHCCAGLGSIDVSTFIAKGRDALRRKFSPIKVAVVECGWSQVPSSDT